MKVSVFPFVLTLLAAIGVSMVGGAPPAQAQDVQSLAETVSRLERQLQTLERNIYRSGGAAPAADSGTAQVTTAGAGSVPGAGAAQLNVRIGEIEEQLRQITGQVEQVGFDVRKLASRFDRFESDVDFRLRSLEQGTPAATGPEAMAPPRDGTAAPGNAASGTLSPPPGTIGTLTESQLRAAETGGEAAADVQTAATNASDGASTGASASPAVALPAGDPATQYEFAFSYLMRRDFPGAESAFRQFVEANPQDPLAGNAQYWLGETYYVRNDFPNAARTFAEGFQRYPDSGKAADNLLKLGLSLAALERKDDACITFTQLATAYPGAPANILQRAKRERDKLGCG